MVRNRGAPHGEQTRNSNGCSGAGPTPPQKWSVRFYVHANLFGRRITRDIWSGGVCDFCLESSLAFGPHFSSGRRSVHNGPEIRLRDGNSCSRPGHQCSFELPSSSESYHMIIFTTQLEQGRARNKTKSVVPTLTSTTPCHA